MEKLPLLLWIYIFLSSGWSIFLGLIMKIIGRSSLIKNFSLHLMRFSRWTQKQIESLALSIMYILIGIIGITLFSIFFQLDLLKYLQIKPEYIIFIFIGIFAQMSVINLLISILTSIFTKIDFTKEIKRIRWINMFAEDLPKGSSAFVALGAAISEELYFRGAFFLIFIIKFPQVGFIFPIIFVTIFFMLQQIMVLETIPQKIAMALGAMVVSSINCLLVLHTKSVLPAVLGHCSFVIFYFRGLGFWRK